MSAFSLTFLGTGTSTGVPMIACDCQVCQSRDPRDKRLRSSVLVESGESTVLVDAGPDLRTQLLRAGVRKIDAVLITHSHTDHIMGLDDLRRFTFGAGDSLPVYAARDTMAALRRVYDFAFNGENQWPGYFKPDPREMNGAFRIGELDITPLPVRHGGTVTHGFLFAAGGVRLAYFSDCKEIPGSTMALVRGTDVLIVDALRRKPHPTHFNVDEALAASQQCRARRTWLTHLSHELGHAELEASLPPDVFVACDGLRLEV